jgi:hypothetical protein
VRAWPRPAEHCPARVRSTHALGRPRRYQPDADHRGKSSKTRDSSENESFQSWPRGARLALRSRGLTAARNVFNSAACYTMKDEGTVAATTSPLRWSLPRPRSYRIAPQRSELHHCPSEGLADVQRAMSGNGPHSDRKAGETGFEPLARPSGVSKQELTPLMTPNFGGVTCQNPNHLAAVPRALSVPRRLRMRNR